MEFPFVDQLGDLNELIGKLADASLFALDTEFIRERTYYPELCVLQIATDRVIAAVDCLADLDLDPLLEVLLASKKTWLLHSARQDLEVLFNLTGKLPERLNDTQVAASLIGLPIQVGLQGLLENTLKIEIGKQHTRANWKRRPMPAAFLDYALDDVRYLIQASHELENRLSKLGRIQWFEEDCARQLALPIEPDSHTIFDRMRGTGRLKAKQRGAALALIEWREQRAKKRNRPRRWILADDQLVRLAAALPESQADLALIKDLPAGLVTRSGAKLLAAIGEAEPAAERAEPAVPDKMAVKSLQAAVKSRAEKLGIQPEILATRRDISQLAAGQLPTTIAGGWRESILGDLIEGPSRDPVS